MLYTCFTVLEIPLNYTISASINILSGLIICNVIAITVSLFIGITYTYLFINI